MTEPRQNSFTYDELIKCGNGELFGEGNARLPIPPMLMMDRIIEINADGGEFGKGQMIAELDVNPDLWFFECHFPTDPVMPGCLGLDAMWHLDDTELSAAALRRNSRGKELDEWGAYIQIATPVAENLYVFARHERVKNSLPAISANVSNIGINYHPIPPVALKLEYRYGHNNDAFATDAWLASFDVLF